MSKELVEALKLLEPIAQNRAWMGVPTDTEAASYLGTSLQEAVFAVEAALPFIRGALSRAEAPLNEGLEELARLRTALGVAKNAMERALYASNGISDNGWRPAGTTGEFDWHMEIPVTGWSDCLDALNVAYSVSLNALTGEPIHPALEDGARAAIAALNGGDNG